MTTSDRRPTSLWTDSQKQQYDEWAKHYETYAKWLAGEPEKHQLYNTAVRYIGRKHTVTYYRGFVDAIGHAVAVVKNSFEGQQAVDTGLARTCYRNAMQTFDEYCYLLMGCLAAHVCEAHKKLPPRQADQYNVTADCRTAEKFQSNSEELQQQPLYSLALEAVPCQKSLEFYIGFRHGFEQLRKLVVKLYADNSDFNRPFEVLKAFFYLQSGFCIGLMIENWPSESVPSPAPPH